VRVSHQVASVDLKRDKLLALLDVESLREPGTEADGGELITCNFGGNSISILEILRTVLSSLLIGAKPVRAVVSADNSRLYVSNFGANSIAVYDIDSGKIIAVLPVGTQPDALAYRRARIICLY